MPRIDLSDLAALLEAERRALLDFDLAALAELEPAKAAILDRLDPTGSHTELEGLLQSARRNDMLYQAALEGFRAALLRLSELQDLQSGFRGYSPEGKVARVAIRSGRLAHKA